MNEYIKRNEIIKTLEERLKDKYRSLKTATYVEDINEIGSEIDELKVVIEIIELDIPAADVEPVRHGYWQVGYFHDRVCSCCLHPDNDFDDYPHDYCPNCGAKMEGGEQNGN